MRTILTRVWRQILEVLFPSICLGCKTYLNKDELHRAICEVCFQKINIEEFLPEKDLIAVSSYVDTSVRALIHGLKFKRFTNTLFDIKQLIVLFLKDKSSTLSAEYDFITFVPLHLQRERTRGFNQARLIAEILASALQLPAHSVLRRVRNTKEQSSIKSPEERSKNVEHCFVPITSEITIKDMKIILVDDVYTSGSTAREAQRTLESLGARKVTIFVLAKAG